MFCFSCCLLSSFSLLYFGIASLKNINITNKHTKITLFATNSMNKLK